MVTTLQINVTFENALRHLLKTGETWAHTVPGESTQNYMLFKPSQRKIRKS